MNTQKSKVIVSGNIAKNVKEFTTAKNHKVIRFTIFQLHDIPNSEKKKPTYINCTLWNSDLSIEALKEGHFIEVEGILDAEIYQAKKTKIAKASLSLNVKAVIAIAEPDEPVTPVDAPPFEGSADDLPF